MRCARAASCSWSLLGVVLLVFAPGSFRAQHVSGACRGSASGDPCCVRVSRTPSCASGYWYQRGSTCSCVGCTAYYTRCYACAPPCAAGKYQTRSCSGSTSGGDRRCTSCPAGKFQGSTGRTSCSNCAAGRYQSYDGQTSCTQCAAGKYSTTVAANTAATCIQCVAGTYSTAGLDACITCVAGLYSTVAAANTADVCIACGAGQFSFAGQTSCSDCAAGTYSVEGLCIDCDAGTYSTVVAATTSGACIDCVAGTYSTVGVSACIECAPGTYSDSFRASVCLSCAAGQYQDSAGQTNCSNCTAGQYEDSAGQTSCSNCDVGQSSSDGQTSCSNCGVGQYSDTAGHLCSDCDVGQYQDLAGRSNCTTCGAGTASSANRTMCLSCDVGRYAPRASGSCTACPPGQADSDSDSATTCTMCLEGTYAPVGSLVCEDCSLGRSDNDMDASTPCAACPRGQFSNLTARIGGCNECAAGRYGPALAQWDEGGCQACLAGQYAESGSAECASCAPGMADTDLDPATQCELCPNGTYASCGATDCSSCEVGKTDADSDASTPCVACVPGQYWEWTDTAAQCVDCQAGRADADDDSITPCALCSIGEYAAARSRTCEQCSETGRVDHDANASTPCLAINGVCTQFCEQGAEDADCDQLTPCTDCPQGQFAEGGYYIEGETDCRPCAPGSYADPGSLPSECVACPAGTADADGNQWTPCQTCLPGTFTANDARDPVASNATRCESCPPGRYDGDGNTTTPCSLCDRGKANPHAGSINASECADCISGRWSYDEGESVCPLCPQGTYRGLSDLDGCITCDTSPGLMCEAGAAYPRAAAGYFAEVVMSKNGETTASVSACVPFPYACLGTCGPTLTKSILEQSSLVDDNDDLGLANCAPGLEGQSCTAGYEGSRCSLCSPVANNFDASSCDESANPPVVNGYYRLESRCVPCPCTWIKFHHMIAAFFLLAIGFMFGLDLVGSELAQHASTLAAPSLILVSFCQTVATFLDTNIPWPAFLRSMMLIFSSLNFNLELTRPECAGKFGALQKVQVALLMPVFVGGAIAVYALISLVKIQRNSIATAEQRRSARSQLLRKLASVATTLLSVGAIFFTKSFLRAFACVASESDSDRKFMASAPEIECWSRSSEHPKIVALSQIGLLSFAGCFAVICFFLVKAHRSDNPGLGFFAFLADKYEDHFFYWEMIITVRKILLMAIFLLLDQVLAVLLATFLTIFSLSIHIAARPFEDTGTDWTEMLSLCAQLLTLTAGPIFVILNAPESGMGPGTASAFRAGLELTGGITMAIAIGTSLFVQMNVWGAVRSTGDEEEDDDYKIRTEQRRLQEMKQLVEEQELIVTKLKEAHAVIRKEKEDVAAMHGHTQPDMVPFETENPLQSMESEWSESPEPIAGTEAAEVEAEHSEMSAETSKDIGSTVEPMSADDINAA